ncbi:hypothetical protein [Deinococcus aquaedulcis]|uniref:hypothetical protein n=1 Tax=Deinococcus aquaedulcis TaxID=2840455 RepID=UPI001C835351|nr:hypothetical protein [Deinococcus aquaedulcis]
MEWIGLALVLLVGAALLIWRPLMPWAPDYAPAQDPQRTLLGHALGFRGPVKRMTVRYYADTTTGYPDDLPNVINVIDLAPDGQSGRITTTIHTAAHLEQLTPFTHAYSRSLRTVGQTVLASDGNKVYERYVFSGGCLRRADDLMFRVFLTQTCDEAGRVLTRRWQGERGERTVHYQWGWKGRSARLSSGERQTYDEYGHLRTSTPATGETDRVNLLVDRHGNWVSVTLAHRSPSPAELSFQAAHDPRLNYNLFTQITREIEYR